LPVEICLLIVRGHPRIETHSSRSLCSSTMWVHEDRPRPYSLGWHRQYAIMKPPISGVVMDPLALCPPL